MSAVKLLVRFTSLRGGGEQGRELPRLCAVLMGLALSLAPTCVAVETPWKAGSDYGTLFSSPLPVDVNSDGVLDVVVLCNDGYLYAFDGSAGQDPPHLFQIDLGADYVYFQALGSAAAADIDFDGDLEIAASTQDLRTLAYAFELDGDPAAGWENGQPLTIDDAYNAPAACDSNCDGSVDLNFVDYSCMWHMFNGVGGLVQKGLTGSEGTWVYSSPAVGDVGPPKVQMGGFGPGPPPQPTVSVPDIVVGSQYTGSNYDADRMQVWAFSTIKSDPGYLNELGIAGWWISGWPKGRDNDQYSYYHYDSSPAIADLDGDGKLDVVVGCSRQGGPLITVSEGPVDVFTAASTAPRHHYTRPDNSNPLVLSDLPWFSSPAVAPLRSSTSRDIVIAGDDGRVCALWVDPNEAELQELEGWGGGIGVDTQYAISGSPSIADIDGDGYLEIVVGSNDGHVYVLDQRGRGTPGHGDGIEYDWDCGGPDYPITCSPTITDIEPEGEAGHGVADIIIANGLGLFKLNLSGNPPPEWDPAKAPWPMFRRNIGRTGCAEDNWPVIPEKGSIAGIVTYNGVPVEAAAVHAQMVLYPPVYRDTTSVSDGKYIFDILTPGIWFVDAWDQSHQHHAARQVLVGAGVQTRCDLQLQ
jgi:hypothetical protein